jgi:hypothetical protein
MPTIEELSSALVKADAAGNVADAKALADAIRQMQAQPAVGVSPYAESPQMLQQPIEFKPAENVSATLNEFPPKEVAAELLKIMSPQGGAPTESNVQALAGTFEKAGSLRDVLNQEVASGGLSPTATLDPQQYPVLAPAWEQYKQEMDPSFFGAMARGAESQGGAAAGGYIGGKLGLMSAPVTGPVGLLLGTAIGAGIGGAVQGAVESFRTPQEKTAAQAQSAFDASRTSTRTGTAIGELAPHLVSMRPALNTIQQAIAGDASAIAAVAIGSTIGGAIPAATGGGIERTIVGAVGGGLMEPRIAPRISAVTPRQLESITAAEQAGIPVYTQDVFRPQGRMGKALQIAGEVLPMGTTAQRVAQQEATQAAAQRTFGRFGVQMSDLGQTNMAPALTAVFQSFDSRRRRILRRYQIQRLQAMEAAAAASPLPVPLTNSLPAIDATINRLRQNTLLINAVRVVQRFRNALVGGNLAVVESVRQSAGELFDAPNLANVRTQGNAAISNLYGPINEDIAAFIQQHGRPNDLTRWRVANAAITRLNREREVAAINHVLNTGRETPEVIRRLIFNAPESTQAVLYGQLSEVGRRNLRTAIMQKAYEDSTFKGQFSPTRFLSQVDDISSNLRVSFTTTQQSELTGLARAIQLTERSQRFAPNAETGVQAVPGQVASAITKLAKTAVGSLLGYKAATHPEAAAAIAGTAAGLGVGLGLTARVYNSQPVRRALVRLSTAPQGTAAEQNAYRILTSAIQAETRKETPKKESK